MRIDANTSQQELERLFAAVMRRDFLLETPLNFKRSFREAVLYILFPCVRLGFRLGLCVLAAFAMSLVALLACGQQEPAEATTKLWLLCGVCVWGYVTILRFFVACRRWRRGMMTRPPDNAQPVYSPTAVTNQLPLARMHERGALPEIYTDLYVAEPGGIAALLVEIHGNGYALKLSDERGVCRVHSHCDGGVFRTFLLIRLSAGGHVLKWLYGEEEADISTMRVQLLCVPGMGASQPHAFHNSSAFEAKSEEMRES